ncbi:hypothetical protein Dred_2414 [Desulforamulus reducens MI-1]|uniref:Flagellar protein FliT n=1 Tax=Desulforamulus reducens (strain ATCC BAA-1160 / DSM 100696 / MI-1) TaxID=349161 RepID=A4J771_DESRM|nr:hypothetical protein [Desulforamulus reducens]ABO50924.1 hypothetical protein Dred_2414 [Desulforamulus reducens MI-1]
MDNKRQALEELYLNKKNIVQEILEITKEMTKFISAEEINALDKHLTKRQELMDKVDEIDKQISLIHIPESQQIQYIKSGIKELIKQIMACDTQHKEDLSKAQLFVKQKLKEAANRKVIKQAYYPQRKQNNGYFIDNKK